MCSSDLVQVGEATVEQVGEATVEQVGEATVEQVGEATVEQVGEATEEAGAKEHEILTARPPVTEQSSEFQVAWIPFRSERSATGFAEKLSLQVNEPFRVVRAGPGKYEVGFDVSSEQHRQQVLAAIAAMTGFANQSRGEG